VGYMAEEQIKTARESFAAYVWLVQVTECLTLLVESLIL
jgi:hypothetical protein